MTSQPQGTQAPHPVGAIILAAGQSRRLGRPKQLLEFRGEPLVRRAARAAVEAALAPVVVVIDPWAAQIRAALADLATVHVVETARFATGMASSLQAGLARARELTPWLAAVVMIACDQPLLDSAHLARLVSVRLDTRRPVVASEYGGVNGVPVLIGAEILDEIAALEGDTGAREIVRRDPSRVATVPFPGGELDIDRPEDMAALAARADEPERK